MLAPPITGSGVPVLASARLAPLTTVVVAFWVLLSLLVSLLALMVVLAATEVMPGPAARQVKLISRTSAPLPASVPMLQSICVGEVGVQLALAGEAETKLAAPAVICRRSAVFSAAMDASLSMRTR